MSPGSRADATTVESTPFSPGTTLRMLKSCSTPPWGRSELVGADRVVKLHAHDVVPSLPERAGASRTNRSRARTTSASCRVHAATRHHRAAVGRTLMCATPLEPTRASSLDMCRRKRQISQETNVVQTAFHLANPTKSDTPHRRAIPIGRGLT